MKGIPPWYHGLYGPPDMGWIGWTSDPAIWQVSNLPSSGALMLTRFRAAQTATIANIDYYVVTAGATLTANQCLFGVYDTGQTTAATATLLGPASADQSTNGTGTGAKVASGLAAPVIAGQDYFAAMLWNGTTIPAIAQGTRYSVQGALSGLSLRAAQIGGKTSLPSTITAATLTTSPWWFGHACR